MPGRARHFSQLEDTVDTKAVGKRMELLCPAGSMETMKTAILYGADAVYLGGEMFGLRAKAKNFDREQMKEAVIYAHAHGVKVHVTVNIIAHNEQIRYLEDYLLFLQEAGVDALIMADAGMIAAAREIVPDMEIHLSTQASATNYATFNFWHKMGVKRVVAAREVSLKEIAEIRAMTSPDLTIEAFAHGAMCISISGRCLLSNYLAGRDSNQGACAHPCRWEYALMEKTREGEYFPVMEGEEGTYVFNSKDLCMIEYLPEMMAAGIGSIKIEGRMKTPLYVAMVTKTYRKALDDLYESEEKYRANLPLYMKWLALMSHRDYTTGFYLNYPTEKDQQYGSAQYVRDSDFVAVLREFQEDGLVLEQRGKFSKGEELSLIPAKGEPLKIPVEELYNADGLAVDSAPHAQEIVTLKINESLMQTIRPVASTGCILVKVKEQ